MNARQQQEAARRLERALQLAGIAIERPIQHGGNIGHYAAVPGEALIGAWNARMWRLRLFDPEIGTVGQDGVIHMDDPRQLRLLDDEDDAA